MTLNKSGYYSNFVMLYCTERKRYEKNFHKEIAIENNQFKETKTWISNSYLIRQSF